MVARRKGGLELLGGVHFCQMWLAYIRTGEDAPQRRLL